MIQRFLAFFTVVTATSIMTLANAQDVPNPLLLHLFVREECAHCIAEKAFLADLERERDDFAIVYHDLAVPVEKVLFDRVVERANLAKATPLTFINGTTIQGFSTANTTGKHIIELINRAKGKPLVTLEDFLSGKSSASVTQQDAGCDESGTAPCTVSDAEYLVHIPLIGSVDMKTFSLPVIAAILGFVDGFNPCAMWVLVTFLLILLQLGDRKKVWQVAGLFIAAESIMYYLILNVWFTAWDFIGLDRFVTPIVGMVAISAGAFFLYEAMGPAGQCKVISGEKRRKTHLRISSIASMPFTILSATAVVGLALSVNIIEFACSVGIPQTFTKILDLNDLTFFGRQSLMAIYIFMYMIDDFIVFGLALWSTEHMHLTHKYSRICNVVGGILMILLGAMLIFAPDFLVFG